MTAGRRTLRDAELDAAISRDGFVRLRPPVDLVASGRALVRSLSRPIGDEHLHISTIHPDLAYRRDVSDAVIALAGTTVESAFIGYEAFHGCFLHQPAGSVGLAGAHQDWTFVDEERHRSFLAWIPLVDVEVGTGALRLAPGSHRLPSNVRPSPVPHPAYGDPARGIADDALVGLPAKAGDIIVFDHAVVHASSPNRSGRARPVLGLFLKPSAASLRHYHLDADGSLLEYRPPDGAWLLDLDPVVGPTTLPATARLAITGQGLNARLVVT